VFTRWINWRLARLVIDHPDNLVDQLRDGTVLSTTLSTVTQGLFQPVSRSVFPSVVQLVRRIACHLEDTLVQSKMVSDGVPDYKGNGRVVARLELLTKTCNSRLVPLANR